MKNLIHHFVLPWNILIKRYLVEQTAQIVIREAQPRSEPQVAEFVLKQRLHFHNLPRYSDVVVENVLDTLIVLS